MLAPVRLHLILNIRYSIFNIQPSICDTWYFPLIFPHSISDTRYCPFNTPNYIFSFLFGLIKPIWYSLFNTRHHLAWYSPSSFPILLILLPDTSHSLRAVNRHSLRPDARHSTILLHVAVVSFSLLLQHTRTHACLWLRQLITAQIVVTVHFHQHLLPYPLNDGLNALYVFLTALSIPISTPKLLWYLLWLRIY